MCKKKKVIKVLCYAEANKGTGNGHYTRLRILISLIRNKIKNTHFTLITNKNNFANSFFFNADTIIFKQSNFKYYISKILNNFDVLILDPPFYVGKKTNNGLYWSSLRKKNSRIKVIRLTEEYRPTLHKVDVLINHFPYAEKFKKFYRNSNCSKKYFLGINSFFYPTHIKYTKKKQNIFFVAFGGNDSSNLVQKLNSLLIKIKIKKIIFVKKNKLSFYNNQKFDKNFTKFIQIKNQESFFKIISRCSFFISTPSNIMYECLYFGLSGIVISTHIRQQKQIKYFKDKKLILSFKKPNLLNEKSITEAFNSKGKYFLDKNKINKFQKEMINYIIKLIKN